MASSNKTAPVRIGAWTFDPYDGSLSGPTGRRRLEDRTARLLCLLASRRGEVVSQEEIVREVWNGRTLSPNSVAVAVSDLRRALGDSARSPRHIETVSKRGYRLLGAEAGMQTEPLPRRRAAIAVAAAVLVVLIGGAVAWLAPRRPVLAVAEVANVTGEARYDPLARSVDDLILLDLQHAARAKVYRAGADAVRGRRALRLTSRLGLWTGVTTVYLTLTDAEGRVVWSGMVMAPPDRLPAGLQAKLRELPA